PRKDYHALHLMHHRGMGKLVAPATFGARAASQAGHPGSMTLPILDWSAIGEDLAAYGCAVIPRLLPAAECLALRGLYSAEEPFRSRIVMARHNFGRGEYKYFRYPLPDTVAALRTALYPYLVPIANQWRREEPYAPTHSGYLALCHAAG